MQCPGQDSRYWESEAIFEVKCPKCQHVIEFFKDDASRTCRSCGHRLLNPRIDFGCAAYCPHAAQCLGSLPEGLKSSAGQSLKDRVAVEMKRFFGTDFKRIGHAGRVAHYAEEINRSEQGDPAVVLISAYLHDIGGSATGHRQQEGPQPAREILTRLGAEQALIEEVCAIIGQHQEPGQEQTTNFKVLHDANLLTRLDEAQKESPSPREQLTRIIATSFLTETGRQLATKVLLQNKTS
ncbi:MAG: HD domain-containing protein [Desulfurivibrio sp.]|nr:MAG: HD domain-containing protein [Desulfurivibrio sp.]